MAKAIFSVHVEVMLEEKFQEEKTVSMVNVLTCVAHHVEKRMPAMYRGFEYGKRSHLRHLRAEP